MKDIVLKMLTPNWFLCIILLMVGYQLVIVVRQFWLPNEQPEVSLSRATAPPTTIDSNKTEETFQFDLFGTASASTENTDPDAQSSLSNAPLSSLNLEVSGIVASSKAENSIAIIAKDTQQFSVGIGEKIPGYDATVAAISNDHIVIKYQGKNESLLLEYDNPVKKTTRDENNSTAEDDSTPLPYKPQNIYDFVNISPVTVNKKLSGYRLNPGKDSQLFYHVGLQDNDLAVSLNGSDLRDAKQAQQIMKQLSEFTEMKITVERDGQLHDVFIAVGGN